MSEMKDMYKEYWFTGSKAILRVVDENGIAPGKQRHFAYEDLPYM